MKFYKTKITGKRIHCRKRRETAKAGRLREELVASKWRLPQDL
jgi:hypothetical protein